MTVVSCYKEASPIPWPGGHLAAHKKHKRPPQDASLRKGKTNAVAPKTAGHKETEQKKPA